MKTRLKIAGWASLAIGAFSAVMVAISLDSLITASQVKGWLQCNGTMLESEIDSYSHIRTGERYRINIRYNYEIDGKKYFGRQLRIGAYVISNKKKAERILASINSNDPIVVYVNPKNHSEAALLSDVNRQHYGAIILWVTLLIFCALSGLKVRIISRRP